MPYSKPDIVHLDFPQPSDVARAVVPLICFATVEWHPVDRVMRQFGLQQCIPNAPPNFDKLHNMDMRGRQDVHWPDKHRRWIALWDIRHTRLVEGNVYHRPLHMNSEYMQWYIRHTRRYISRDGAFSGSTEGFARIIQDYTRPSSSARNPTQTLQSINFECSQMLSQLGQIHPSQYSDEFQMAAPPQEFTMPEEHVPEQPAVQPPSPEDEEPDTQPAQDFYHSYPLYPSFADQPASSSQIPYNSYGIQMTPQPSSFSAYASTPYSAFASVGYYRPTLPTQTQDPDDTGFTQHGSQELVDTEVPTRRVRTRGGRVRSRGGGTSPADVAEPPQQRRVQPQRRRKPPPCGTSSRHTEPHH